MQDNQERYAGNIKTESAALPRRGFIIKADGKYYGTTALWEYDPHAEGLTQDQGQDVAELERMFETERQSGPVYPTVGLRDGGMISFEATRPPSGHN